MMDQDKLLSELVFKAVRSSGAGGQNVNKVSSKIVLSFDVAQSEALSEAEKERIVKNLAPRLTFEKVLILHSDQDRSQLRNKENAIRRFLEILTKALVVPKSRKPTKVPRSVIEKRIKEKRNQSEIKQSRQKPKF